MPYTILTQEAIYNALRQGDTSVLASLYPSLHRRTISLIRQWGGSPDEATDLLHEAILITIYNIRYNRYIWTGDAELTTYVIAIARNLWLATQRRTQRFVNDTPLIEEADDEADRSQAEQHFESQRQATEVSLQQLDPNCRQTLELYYWEKLTMAQLAKKRGWANEAVARKNKSNCLRKLRQLVETQLAKINL